LLYMTMHATTTTTMIPRKISPPSMCPLLSIRNLPVLFLFHFFRHYKFPGIGRIFLLAALSGHGSHAGIQISL
jgi:hypothetical protein